MTHHEDRQDGQVIVAAALLMVVLLLFAGLAVDAGLVLDARRKLVSIADAAALAGAGALSSGLAGEPNDWVRQQRAVARVREYAALNGFDPDTPGNTLDVEVTFSGRKLVTVNAVRRVPLVFMRLVGIDEATVAAHGEGCQAEAPPLDIVLVQDVSASQCFGTHALKPAQQDCEYIVDPSSPSDPDKAFLKPYDATKPTVRNLSSRWFYYSSTIGRGPGCKVSGIWQKCSGGPEYTSINEPWEPFSMQQTAASYFVSQLDSRYDQIALVSFSWDYAAHSGDPYGRDYNARLWAGLTSNLNTVIDAIGSSPLTEGTTGDKGLYPGGNTNMAAGLRMGVAELTTSAAARENAVPVIILLGDGSPTTLLNGSRPSSCVTETGSGCSGPRSDTVNEAQAAADQGVLVYTVFVGTPYYAQDAALMLQYIADLTDNHSLEGNYGSLISNGGPAYEAAYFQQHISENYFLASNEAELQAAYEQILRMIYTRLVR